MAWPQTVVKFVLSLSEIRAWISNLFPVDNKSLFGVTAWLQTVDKPFQETMVIRFTAWYIPHYATLQWHHMSFMTF